jgi:hypothetical protein
MISVGDMADTTQEQDICVRLSLYLWKWGSNESAPLSLHKGSSLSHRYLFEEVCPQNKTNTKVLKFPLYIKVYSLLLNYNK